MFYFSADGHFYSEVKNSVELKRLVTAEEYADTFVKNVNEMLAENDTLYYLGDFFNYSRFDTETWKQASKIVSKLRCKVVLIVGNNELRLINGEFTNHFKAFAEWCKDIGFADVLYDTYIDMRGKKFYCSHNPSTYKNGMVNLFGHIHNMVRVSPVGINVYPEFTHELPISEDELFNVISDVIDSYSTDTGFLAVFRMDMFPIATWRKYLED